MNNENSLNPSGFKNVNLDNKELNNISSFNQKDYYINYIIGLNLTNKNINSLFMNSSMKQNFRTNDDIENIVHKNDKEEKDLILSLSLKRDIRSNSHNKPSKNRLPINKSINNKSSKNLFLQSLPKLNLTNNDINNISIYKGNNLNITSPKNKNILMTQTNKTNYNILESKKLVKSTPQHIKMNLISSTKNNLNKRNEFRIKKQLFLPLNTFTGMNPKIIRNQSYNKYPKIYEENKRSNRSVKKYFKSKCNKLNKTSVFIKDKLLDISEDKKNEIIPFDNGKYKIKMNTVLNDMMNNRVENANNYFEFQNKKLIDIKLGNLEMIEELKFVDKLNPCVALKSSKIISDRLKFRNEETFHDIYENLYPNDLKKNNFNLFNDKFAKQKEKINEMIKKNVKLTKNCEDIIFKCHKNKCLELNKDYYK